MRFWPRIDIKITQLEYLMQSAALRYRERNAKFCQFRHKLPSFPRPPKTPLCVLCERKGEAAKAAIFDGGKGIVVATTTTKRFLLLLFSGRSAEENKGAISGLRRKRGATIGRTRAEAAAKTL